MSRRLGVVLVLVLLACAVAPAVAGAAAATAWVRPVAGVVVRPFDPPRTRFGAGHLGVDLAAPARTPVHAAGLGVVSFAGTVAGSLHVVIAHAGNLRTSYSFLASVAVRRGATVAAGDVIGTTGGKGQGHDGAALHFALRVGETYVDPMVLFRPVDLVAVVHLAPTSDAPRPAADESERRGLLAGLTHDFGAATRAVGAGIAASARGATRMIAAHLPLPAAAARGTAAWLAQYGHCAAHAPLADGYGGSGHRVMLVAGIESSLTGGFSSLGLPTAELGYEPAEVTNFSYAADGGDYAPPDTEGPLLIAARRLARQMRALERRDPGREVDLLAHSQGGVVVEAFLTQIYKPSDPSYPPIGTVVTLSSPLRGDPGAEAIAKVRSTESGDAALALADRVQQAVHRVVPPPGSAALRDLARGSALMKQLNHAKFPEGVKITTVGAATDVIVPGNAAELPGAEGATVLPYAVNAHTGIVTDPSALQNVRAALEGKPLPCRSLASELAGEIGPTVVSSVEQGAGDLGAAVARVADGRP